MVIVSELAKQAIPHIAQGMHGFIVVLLCWLLGTQFTIIGAAMVGVGLGTVREISKSDPFYNFDDFTNVLFWTLGAVAAGFIFS